MNTMDTRGKRPGADGGTRDARRGGLRALAPSVRKVTMSFLGRRSVAEGTLLAEWPSVVGADVARMCRPRRLTFPRQRDRREGTLVLRVNPAEATRLAHLEPIVIERVNAFFGYRAVARLQLEHGRLTRRDSAPARAPRELRREETQAVARSVESVGDDELREALGRLGRTIRAYAKE